MIPSRGFIRCTLLCVSHLSFLQIKYFEVSIMIWSISQHWTQRIDMIIAYLLLFLDESF